MRLRSWHDGKFLELQVHFAEQLRTCVVVHKRPCQVTGVAIRSFRTRVHTMGGRGHGVGGRAALAAVLALPVEVVATWGGGVLGDAWGAFIWGLGRASFRLVF